jgi:DeoR family transcriptional regulator, fructose operon transcriptional repressor
MKRTRNKEERLLEALRINGKLTIKEIVNLFGISEATARRLCTRLEKCEAVIRTHGGIQYLSDKAPEYLFDKLQLENIEDKKRIGKYAASMVNDGDIVFLDAGTTLQTMAVALAARLENGELRNRNVVVFTNSIINLEVLSPYCKVMILGGEYRAGRRDVAGLIAERFIKTFHFTKCFLGTDAINIDDGLMAMDIDTVRTDELLLSKTTDSYILADSSKFSKHSFISFGNIGEVAHIITDAKIDGKILEALKTCTKDIVCV